MTDHPKPNKPEPQSSSAIMVLGVFYLLIFVVLCSACAIWVLAR